MGNPHRDRHRRQQRGGQDKRSDDYQRYGSMDVSIDGRAPDRQERGRFDRGGDRPRQPRQKLEFREVKSLEQGDCRCRITMADGRSGSIYNFTVERQNRDRTSRFFRDADIDDLTTLIVRATDYILDAKAKSQ